MLSHLLALTAVALLVPAAAARADDCASEDFTGSVRAPVIAAARAGAVLGDVWDDQTAGAAGPGDTAQLFSLPATAKAASARRLGTGVSPSLVTRPGGGLEVVQYRAGGRIVATPGAAGGRTLVTGVAFPGYHGLAAGEARDGTITLAYAIPGAPARLALQRVAPDGRAGPPTILPGVGADPAPRMTVSRESGAAYVLIAGAHRGLAIYWPPDDPPQVTASPRLTRAALDGVQEPIAVDELQEGWERLASGTEVAVAELDATGLEIDDVTASAADSAGPAVTGAGHAIVAWSSRGGTSHLQDDSSAAGVLRPRPLGGGRPLAVAVDPRSGATLTLAIRSRALVLERVGKPALTLRARRGYDQSDASLAIASTGRAWAVWEESSDRLDPLCRLFPVHHAIRWTTFPATARRVATHVLAGAPENAAP
jgi:hypothetical protein